MYNVIVACRVVRLFVINYVMQVSIIISKVRCNIEHEETLSAAPSSAPTPEQRLLDYLCEISLEATLAYFVIVVCKGVRVCL